MITVIKVLRCHIDDFKKHPGWWATMDPQPVEAGEIIIFDLDGTEFVRCLVTSNQRGDPEKHGRDFINWWVISYTTKHESLDQSDLNLEDRI